MKEKILSKDHNWETNGESNQWHEQPATVKFNLKSILVLWNTPKVMYSLGEPLKFLLDFFECTVDDKKQDSRNTKLFVDPVEN